MTTARLTWVVLDRLVPTGEEPVARAALIARDPELQSLVSRGILTEEEAVATLRARQSRYGEDEGMIGDRFVQWVKRLAALSGASFLTWLAVNVAR